MLTVILLYTVSKVIDFVEKRSPIVRDLVLTDYFDASDQYNLNQANYRIAFSFEGEDDDKLKDDPRYVKIIARFWHRKDGIKGEKILNYHKCTEEDLNEFYPVAKESQKLYD